MNVQVAHVQADTPLQITDLLKMTPTPGPPSMYEFYLEQQKDTRVKELYDYVASGVVPNDEQQAKKVCGQAVHFAVVDSTKQKHLGCKKVRGQSEATLLTGMCDQKL